MYFSPYNCILITVQNGELIDIGDIEFTTVNNYSFVIDGIPIWPGGTTAVPTDRLEEASHHLALFMAMTLLWMIVAFIVGAIIEYRQYLRIPETGIVVIFGIIAGLILRSMSSGVSSVS